MNKFIYTAAAIILATAIASCNKEENGTSHMTVKMTDAPGDFQQVNVEVLEVRVHHNSGWVTLPTNQGVYDLLTLQNDITTVLVNQGEIPAGHIDQFRLILGANNTVMIDSLIFPLQTPSAQQSGLKINVNGDFAPNETYELLIDFDAGQSIVEQGNGGFLLKPVIKLESIIQL
jgi:hypothetical protein